MKTLTHAPVPVILSTLAKIEAYIIPTYGPAGRGILVDNGYQQTIIDDGYLALEELEFDDELENAVLSYVRDAVRAVNKRAGDATTTTIILLIAIVRATFDEKNLSRPKPVAARAQILAGALAAVEQIRAEARTITSVEELIAIARSAYDDEEVARTIGSMVYELGTDGVISVDATDQLETEHELLQGLSFDRGFLSHFMALPTGELAELPDVSILITSQVIDKVDELMPLFEQLQKEGKGELLIIAEGISDTALDIFNTNAVRGNFKAVVVKAPSFDTERKEILDDIATLTGGVVIGEGHSIPLSGATMELLGKAKLAKITKDETTIIGGAGDKFTIEARMDALKALTPASEFEKSGLARRIAQLSGGIGQIRVGAPTENEAKAKRMKVEDAVHATQLAHKTGVVPGGGAFLAGLETGSALLDEALEAPLRVLIANGREALSASVLDAAGVVEAAVQSACSTASQLITAGGIIARKRDDAIANLDA